jgi:hypothetical protein
MIKVLMVPRTGFEPAHPCERCDLNTVRLPISPPGQIFIQGVQIKVKISLPSNFPALGTLPPYHQYTRDNQQGACHLFSKYFVSQNKMSLQNS